MSNVVHKSKSPFGDLVIFMNGKMLYKTWPNGMSMLFEEYGPNTTNKDRDNGGYSRGDGEAPASYVTVSLDKLGDEEANKIVEELMRLRDDNERLRQAADKIAPYLIHTIGNETSGHHPTMPSAVVEFLTNFDIETDEKRYARSVRQVNQNRIIK